MKSHGAEDTERDSGDQISLVDLEKHEHGFPCLLW
jgi:hypothetical protein